MLRVPSPSAIGRGLHGADRETHQHGGALRQAACSSRPHEGILAAVDEPLVSIDYKGDPHSSSVDLPFNMVLGKGDNDFIKVLVTWYDNEWGTACAPPSCRSPGQQTLGGHAQENSSRC